MKNLFTWLLLSLTAAILLSSCGRSMSLTKRHYRNGYHFQQAGKNFTPKSAEQLTNQSKKTGNSTKEVTPVKEIAKTMAANSNTIETVPAVKERYNIEAFTKHAITSNANALQVITASAKNSVLSTSFLKQQVQSVKMKRSSEDGLSLFWLIILILLIIWFFGFFAGGWGLGGLINLLLVIALILLILWLLRII